MPIDPDADRGRRAWLPCPSCDHGKYCGECNSPRNCVRHWQYLLRNQAWVAYLQCPTCGYLWTTDTQRRHRRPWRKAA